MWKKEYNHYGNLIRKKFYITYPKTKQKLNLWQTGDKSFEIFTENRYIKNDYNIQHHYSTLIESLFKFILCYLFPKKFSIKHLLGFKYPDYNPIRTLIDSELNKPVGNCIINPFDKSVNPKIKCFEPVIDHKIDIKDVSPLSRSATCTIIHNTSSLDDNGVGKGRKRDEIISYCS